MIERRRQRGPDGDIKRDIDHGPGPLGPFAVRLAGVPAHLGVPNHTIGTSVSGSKRLSGSVRMGLRRK